MSVFGERYYYLVGGLFEKIKTVVQNAERVQ